MSSSYTSAQALNDMFLLAWVMYSGGYAESKNKSAVDETAMFDSQDIFQTGMDVLEEKVDQFNCQYTRLMVIPSTLLNTNDVDTDPSTFADVAAYAEAMHSDYDSVDL